MSIAADIRKEWAAARLQLDRPLAGMDDDGSRYGNAIGQMFERANVDITIPDPLAEKIIGIKGCRMSGLVYNDGSVLAHCDDGHTSEFVQVVRGKLADAVRCLA